MSFEDIIFLSIKTLACYFFLIFTLKLMGKREIGKVSTFDIVVFFVISELFSLSLNDPKGNLLHSLVPISIIVCLQIITAKIAIKNRKFRNFMEGEPTFLIYKGKVNFKAMKKNRYNSDDLLLQLRAQNIISLDDVKFAILEQNGSLIVFKKCDCEFDDPFPVVQEGKINNSVLKRANVSLEMVYKIIFNKGYSNKDEIFLMFLKEDDALLIPFEKEDEVDGV
jgi:uncharacterized membrane protein YcaP (DUF421 family)